MNITKITITKFDEDYRINNHIGRNTLAKLDIIIDHDMAVNNILLLNGEKGEYLKFPDDDKGRHIAFPIKEETRLDLLNQVLEEYYKEV